MREVIPVLLDFYKKFDGISLDKDWFKSNLKINKIINLKFTNVNEN